MKIFKVIVPFLIIFVLSYFAIQPFFSSGFFPMHDDTQVARVFEMNKALSDGAFPVRWVADLGYNYGYPIFNFYAPLAYYFGAAVQFLGFDSLIATKIMMAVGMILAGIFMYFLAKEFWGKAGGILSALLYVYAPYHALDVYVRGDTAEFWAYAFVPLAFYGVWKSFKERKWSFIVVGSLGYAGIILSHNLTAMMITPFLLIFCLFLYIRARREEKIHKPYYPLLVLFLGVILAAFYWLPVFPEMRFTNVLSQVGGGADYKEHFVCVAQLWNSPWGFGGSTPTCIDGLSFKIGKLHLILFIFAAVGLFFLRKKNKSQLWFGAFSIFSTVFAVFLMLGISQFIWDTFSPMAFFQYPWRFLLIVTFFVSFLGGAVSILLNSFVKNRNVRYAIFTFIAFSIIYINLDVFVPQRHLAKTVNDYVSKYALTWKTTRISDEYMPKNFYEPRSFEEVPQEKFTQNSDIKILSLSEKTNRIYAEVEAKKKTDILVNLAYFPTWHVFIDGKQEWFKYHNKGIIVTVPSGKHTIVVSFAQTTIEKVANFVSLAGVFILILGIIIQRKDTRHGKKTT